MKIDYIKLLDFVSVLLINKIKSDEWKNMSEKENLEGKSNMEMKNIF